MNTQTIGHLTTINAPLWKSMKKHVVSVGMSHYLVFADHEGDALDEVIDYIAENNPGMLADDQVNEAYKAAIDCGATEEQAWECATADTITGGNCGNHLISWEVQLTESPSREYILRLQQRA